MLNRPSSSCCLVFILSLFIYFERGRENVPETGKGRERGRETISTEPELWDHAWLGPKLSRVKCLTDWATQAPLAVICNLYIWNHLFLQFIKFIAIFKFIPSVAICGVPLLYQVLYFKGDRGLKVVVIAANTAIKYGSHFKSPSLKLTPFQ